MRKNIDVSIVIVNYNTVNLLDSCLGSIWKHRDAGLKLEVIVVDNNSSDRSAAMVRSKYPHVVLVENIKNDGYAKANNIGLKKASGGYLLLLNSDTELIDDVLEGMIHFMDNHPQAGAATCKILLPDKSLDPACHRGFPTPWVSFTYLSKLEKLFPKTKFFGEYHQGYKNINEIHEVDCISGAFFLIRRKVTEDIGLLDEDYFMYGEDIDWAFRIRNYGWKIYFNPHVSIWHKKKQSGRLHIEKKQRLITEVYFHKYNWLFYKKNYAKRYGVVLTTLINVFYTIRIFLLEHFFI